MIKKIVFTIKNLWSFIFDNEKKATKTTKEFINIVYNKYFTTKVTKVNLKEITIHNLVIDIVEISFNYGSKFKTTSDKVACLLAALLE